MEAQGYEGGTGALTGEIDLLEVLDALHGAVGPVAKPQIRSGRDLHFNHVDAVIFIAQQTPVRVPAMEGVGQGRLGQGGVKAFAVQRGTSLLDGRVHHSLDKVLLKEQEDDYDGQDCQQGCGRGRVDVAGGLGEVGRDGQGDGAQLGGLKDIERELLVVPAVDAGEYDHRGGDRLELGQDNPEEGAYRPAAVDGGGLVQSARYGADKIAVEEDGEGQFKGDQD